MIAGGVPATAQPAAGVHQAGPSDLLRRPTKEELRTFDGRPLFPERRAYTVNYRLSAEEADLYEAVTDYVRNEMNRAERLAENDQRRNNVGFALQILQRRLASSPAAIHESLRRRRERLERRLEEERVLQRGRDARLGAARELAAYRPEFFAPWSRRPCHSAASRRSGSRWARARPAPPAALHRELLSRRLRAPRRAHAPP